MLLKLPQISAVDLEDADEIQGRLQRFLMEYIMSMILVFSDPLLCKI
jgi:hypothetical protein